LEDMRNIPAMKTQALRTISDFGINIISGALYAIALKYFVLPSRIILTGTEGIASSLSYFFDDYTLFIRLYVIFQTVLVIFAFFKVSRAFALRTLMVVVTVTLFLRVLPELHFAQPEPQNERILLVIFGGILAGTAKALAFKRRGSTGDEDILGAYFAMKYLKPVGAISVIAATLSTLFGLALNLLKTGDIEITVNTLMYTCIYIFISAEMLNNLYRKFQITLFTIVTTDHVSMGKVIRETLSHRTYTVQSGSGGHSGEAFWIVKTIITKEELPALLMAIERSGNSNFYYHHDLEGISKKYYITPIG